MDIHYVDVYDALEEAQKLGISAVPTLVFYDSDGNVVEQNVGSMERDQLRERLNKLKAG